MKIQIIASEDKETGRVCVVPFEGKPVVGMEPLWFPNMLLAQAALNKLADGLEASGMGTAKRPVQVSGGH